MSYASSRDALQEWVESRMRRILRQAYIEKRSTAALAMGLSACRVGGIALGIAPFSPVIAAGVFAIACGGGAGRRWWKWRKQVQQLTAQLKDLSRNPDAVYFSPGAETGYSPAVKPGYRVHAVDTADEVLRHIEQGGGDAEIFTNGLTIHGLKKVQYGVSRTSRAIEAEVRFTGDTQSTRMLFIPDEGMDRGALATTRHRAGDTTRPAAPCQNGDNKRWIRSVHSPPPRQRHHTSGRTAFRED